MALASLLELGFQELLLVQYCLTPWAELVEVLQLL